MDTLFTLNMDTLFKLSFGFKEKHWWKTLLHMQLQYVMLVLPVLIHIFFAFTENYFACTLD